MRYFEDFQPGEVLEFGSRTVTEEEMLAFARQFDPQPFHIDPEAAKRSIYGGLIASGWHTAALMMRMYCDNLLKDTAGMGSPGMEELRWPKPVRPGDTLSVRYQVRDTKPSRSRPEMGLVFTTVEVVNQKGEIVMTMNGTGFVRRREAAQA